MRSRAFVTFISVIVALVLLAGTCSAGFVAGRMFDSPSQVLALLPGEKSATTTAQGQGDTPKDLQELFTPFWQTWDLVHQEYVDQPVNDETLMRGAIRGMLESLGDPPTVYLDPKEYQMLTAQLQGEESYEGIGAWVDTTRDYLTIIGPIPGSPAEKVGLRTGDKIIAIDGKDMTGIDGELVRKQVLGPAGTQVTLTIQRVGQEPFDVKITRAKITIPSIHARMLDNDIAYVRLLIFADNTKDELEKALKELLAQKPRALILDLRGNGGGLLNSAIDVASEFIDKGVIVSEQYGDGKKQDFEARNGGLATDIPMVVLINQGSASASEIVAGAIQDLSRGKLVGVKSYGKGSVQIATPLKNDEGAARITVAHWLTPNGRTIQGVGLTPDVEVQITEEDFAQNRDPQLDKAVELLSTK